MDWFYAISSLLAGLLLLMFAGDWLIGAAVNLGTRWNLSPIFMGTTVVAAGTSLPELVVAVIAQVEGSSGLTLGNVIGSNIFNIGVVLGLIFIWKDQKGLVGGKTEIRVLILLTLGFLGLIYGMQDSDGVANLDVSQGSLLLLIFAVLLVLNFLRGRAQGAGPDIDELLSDESALKTYLKLVSGMLGLWIGADLLVSGASNLAQLIGISETVVGLTVVAAGTGAPELFASIVALRKGSTGIALGNIVGSNIFNTIAIIGAASVVAPLPLNISALSVDLIVMAAMTGSLVLLGSLIKGRLPVKAVGVLLFGTYCWWLIQLI
ncbi:MAG: calcium/sodium antiporter [Planctomycetes bacterium]|nr:calcium/sodium antiporter [Planctomycetota bacterium]